MSLPRDTEPDPSAEVLLTSALRAAEGVEVAGCPDAEVLGLYAERALTGPEGHAVETHVHACPRCQATVAAFVRALPDEVGADGATAGAGETPAGGFAAWFAGWRWLVPATSLAAAALVAIWVGRGPADPVEDVARATAPATDSNTAAPEAMVTPGQASDAFVPADEGQRADRRLTLERRGPSRAGEIAGGGEPQSAGDTTAGVGASREAATPDTQAKATAPEERRAASEAMVAADTNLTPATRAPSAAPPPPLPPPPAPRAARPERRTTAFSALAPSPWRVVDGRVERSRDGGDSWQPVVVPAGVRVIAAGSPGGDVCWLVTDAGVLRTTDGRTWTPTTRPTSDALAGVVPASADRASVFTAAGARWVTSDGGRTWVAER